MDFLTLTGESCFAPWEAQKLVDQLNKPSSSSSSSSASKVTAVRGVWVYFASITGDHAPAVPLSIEAAVRGTRKLFVSPRNESPWSSKATSIAQVCGYGDSIKRIERGRVVVIEFEGEDGDGEGKIDENVVYDRMTENLGGDWPDQNQMFGEGEPKALEVVDIFNGGDKSPVEVLEEYNKKHGLALDKGEIEYLVKRFTELGYVHTPADVRRLGDADKCIDARHMMSSSSCSARSTRSTAGTSYSTPTGRSMAKPRPRVCSR